MAMMRAIVREMPDGSARRVYPFHVSLEGLKKAIICRDEEDYELEVGSAGLGQPFRVHRQYEIHVGKEVETQLHDGHKFRGTLLSVNDKGFQLGIVQKVKEEGKKRPVTMEVPTDFRFEDVAYTKYLIKVK